MPDTSWLDLLSWLEKHGFDESTLKVDLHESPAGGGRKLVATSDIIPQQKLISLPTSTLLNSVTIAPLYDYDTVEKLSAIQLSCLHLSLHRFTKSSFSETAEDFIPYIRTLPQDFSTVPLWREVTKDESWTSLFTQDGLIPSGFRRAVEDVSERFWKDWKVTNDTWSRDGSRPLIVEDYAWAWLCVNSRCIYYDLELPSREDNITLAPIIDMGNHSSGQPTKIVQLDDDFCLLSSGYDTHIGDWTKKTILIKTGEEVKYSYSAHSDYILLAEYGFAMGMPANSDNVLDVTERVMRLFEELEAEERELKKSILEANDYWGEYHFILSEGQVDVSYRLTMALALFHMKRSNSKAKPEQPVARPSKGSKTIDATQADWDFEPFYDLVNGIREDISAENVRLSNETLQRLCRAVEDDCKAALALLADAKADETMLELLRTIWKDELWFAVHYKATSNQDS